MDLELAALLTVIIVAVAAVDVVVDVVAGSLLIVIVDFDLSPMAVATLTFVNRRLITRRCRRI